MTTPADDILLRMLQVQHLPCPVCGYDLHRLTAPRCTECGKGLALKVVLVEPPLRRAWIFALAAGCLNASLGLLMIIIATVSRGSVRGELLPPGSFFDAAFYVQFALILCPLALLLFRRRHMQLPMSLQSLLAIILMAWGLAIFFAMALHVH